ncbi:TetR/AcrR family transcriptional regulator [Propionibacterium sp.]|uniref:TetR/AcrR family transcriptional regulator n=1 Tax=Propionibacterium sp. TaxID=1977903 RepID=UPI0039E825E8
MPEQPRSIRSHQAIIEATAELIRTRGVSGISIADIIAESGTSAGSIYHHFPNKQAIVVEVAHQAMRWPLTAIDAYADNPSSPAELFGFAVEALRFDTDLADLLVQLGSGALTDDGLGRHLRAEFTQLRDALDATLGSWAECNGVAHERVNGLGQMLVGLILGFAAQRVLVDEFNDEAYLAHGKALLMAPVERN